MGNRWDHRYRSGEYAEKEPEPMVVEYASGLPAGRALDIACGLGRHARWLARRGWHVTAVDYSEVALSAIRTSDLPIETVHADIEAGEMIVKPAAYDLILDCCFLWRPIFGAVRDGLKVSGMFIGVYPVSADRPTNPAYLLEAAELLGFFPGWEILHYDEASSRNRTELVAIKPTSHSPVT